VETWTNTAGCHIRGTEQNAMFIRGSIIETCLHFYSRHIGWLN